MELRHTSACLFVCYLHRAKAQCVWSSQTSPRLPGAGIPAILLASLPRQLEGKAISGMKNDKSTDPGFLLLAQEGGS